MLHQGCLVQSPKMLQARGIDANKSNFHTCKVHAKFSRSTLLRSLDLLEVEAASVYLSVFLCFPQANPDSELNINYSQNFHFFKFLYRHISHQDTAYDNQLKYMGKCAANDSNCVEMLAFEMLTIWSMQKQKCTTHSTNKGKFA